MRLFTRLALLPVVVAGVCSCATVSSQAPPGAAPGKTSNLYDSIVSWRAIPRGDPDYAAAQDRIARTEKLLGDEVNLQMERAATFMGRGDLDGAEEGYRSALALDPRRTDAADALGRLLPARELIEKHSKHREERLSATDLRGAMLEDDVILTILPEYGPAQANRKSDEARAMQQAEQFYQQGLRHLNAGDERSARRSFLQALQRDPAQRGALAYFWADRTGTSLFKAPSPPPPSEPDYFLYTLQKGESISMLAERFYGDKFKYPVIATYNNLSDPTKVDVGQKIKIPRTEYMVSRPAEAVALTVSAPSTGTSEYTQATLEQAKSLLENKAYGESIEEAKKVLGESPGNVAARDIMLEAYYQEGLDSLRKKLFEQAIRVFNKIKEIMPDYRDVLELLGRAKRGLDNFIDELYKEGITLYREQRLEEALSRWSEVLRLDPAHDGALKYSEKARQLLERLKTMDKK